eukprot:UN17276
MIKKNRETSPFIWKLRFRYLHFCVWKTPCYLEKNQRSNPQSKSETSRCSQHFLMYRLRCNT